MSLDFTHKSFGMPFRNSTRLYQNSCNSGLLQHKEQTRRGHLIRLPVRCFRCWVQATDLSAPAHPWAEGRGEQQQGGLLFQKKKTKNNNKVCIARASAAARGVSFMFGRFFGKKHENPVFCEDFVNNTMFRCFRFPKFFVLVFWQRVFESVANTMFFRVLVVQL